jgi:chemotaxis protein CheD
MAKVMILGVGDLGASKGHDVVIRTFALGSCVALIAYDLKAKVAGMVHVALPESRINTTRARLKPGTFADTGVDALLAAMAPLRGRSGKSGLVVKLVGGANVMDKKNFFAIGQRNIKALHGELEKIRIFPMAEDVGGSFSRTVSIQVATGRVYISSPGRDIWEL